MSVPTTTRVDASAPVLAQLVDAATKAFTGSLEVSATDAAGRDLQVVVWLEDGNISAVHAPGWTPPAAAYVLYRTGEDFSGREESPFKLAFETLRDGEPLLTGAELDTPRRDWAYGLLASSLTWTKPKFHRTKKVTTATNRINISPWQLVTADLNTRVDGLESAWRVVCDALIAAGIRPVSAGRACAMLAVRIDGHALFTGTESLDQVAGRCGISRYTVLQELSRAILLGGAAQFQQAPTREDTQPVPEHWEDATRGWGWVDETPVVVDAPEPAEPELVGDVEEPEPEAPLEVVVHEEIEPEFVVDVEPEPSQAPEPELEVEPTVVEPLPVVPAGPANAWELINAWLRGAASKADANVRNAIVHRLVSTAPAEAAARGAEVAAAVDALDRADEEAQTAHEAVAGATSALASAQAAYARADDDVARADGELADELARVQVAATRAEAVRAQARAEQAALERLLEQVTVQQGVLAAANEGAEQADLGTVAAQQVVDGVAAPALARCREVAECVHEDQVAPAHAELTGAQAREAAAVAAVAAASDAVDDAGVAASNSKAIAEVLDFDEQTLAYAA